MRHLQLFSKLYLKKQKDETCGNTLFTSIVHQNNCILIGNHNTYTTNQKMKVYLHHEKSCLSKPHYLALELKNNKYTTTLQLKHENIKN
jgi:hypothetical protein